MPLSRARRRWPAGAGVGAVIAPFAALFLAAGVFAQNLLPNAGFESGTTVPQGWRPDAGQTQWTSHGREGGRALQVSGDGDDASEWRADKLGLTPASLYRLRFFGRRDPGASGGTAVSGIAGVNRDFTLTDTWQPCEFVFQTPDVMGGDFVRLGQWHVRGMVLFDDAGLWPVQAVHRRGPNGLELGEGESTSETTYRFDAHFGGAGANYHRTLNSNRAGFNSDRWVFGPDSEVIYRFNVAGCSQKSGRLRTAINYYQGGTLRIEAGTNALNWIPVANLDGKNRAGSFELPGSLFPSRECYIRLSQADKTGALQVNALEYLAGLDRQVPTLRGETHYLEVHDRVPPLSVRLETLDLSPDRKTWQLQFALQTTNSKLENLTGTVTEDATPPPLRTRTTVASVASAPSWSRVTLSYPLNRTGMHSLRIEFAQPGRQPLFAGRLTVHSGLLDDPRPGYWLGETANIGYWWAESGWKIGRERGLPERPRNGKPIPLRVSLAQGEFEPMQLVLRPKEEAQLLSVNIRWKGRSANARVVPTARIDEVAFVPVRRPTDSTCLPGWYPDPLPPLRLPLALRPHENQPLWITWHAPRNCAAGDYAGEIEMCTTLGDRRWPVEIRVYGFAMPRETHLRSALGLSASTINQYHSLTRREDQQAVHEKYLHNFAEHRISPYSFYPYAPIEVRFEGDGTNKHARIDFSRFDRAAARWLDEARLSTFQLALRGMGGGTFQSRHLGTLEGFQEGTPEHARLFQDYLSQVEAHLRERGWLNKAFTYWFDEPDPKDYEFVIAGMKRLKAAAPGVKRLLTEQPEPALLGHVDIWCGLTPEWTRERVRERRAAGEEVWWYICCGPTAPYITEFIDHPGTELRLWPWQSWQNGVTGILVWETTYWTSPLVFPPPKRQDPWTDPMSYVSGYDYPVGHVGYWGNGDGRFLYPPRPSSAATSAPCLEEPINSLRWENLRDGIEDYEYLWLLQQEVARLDKNDRARASVAKAKTLLTVPPNISQDLTHFTTDPRPLLRHRDQVAQAILTLRRF